MTSEAIGYHDTAGCRLRCAREQLSLSIRDVARSLKLLASHVRAIEADRCNALARDEQFLLRLQDYANLVELDPNELVDSFRSQSAAVSHQQQADPAPGGEKRSRRVPWIAVGALALLGVVVEIWLLSNPSRLDADLTALAQEESIAGQSENTSPARKSVAHTTEQQAAMVKPATVEQQPLAGQSADGKPLRSTQWFAAQAPDRYTIQLLSVRDRNSTREFIRKHRLENETAYFAVSYSNETWYAVTYGLYDSYEAAVAASKALPDTLDRFTPLVRNTGLIQETMLRE